MNKINKKLSYSSLSLYKQCPLQYKLKYIDKNYSNVPNLAFELGNLCHKVKELQYKTNGGYSQQQLLDILNNGLADTDRRETVTGIEILHKNYIEDFNKLGNKSKLNYKQKLEIFKSNLFSPIEEEWEVVATELPFEFKYLNETIIGKIDRIDRNKVTGGYRVVDYKTSDSVYDDKQLPTALQMFIYNLALKVHPDFGEFAVSNEYDFIFLNKKQYALTKGWENRGHKALSKIVNDLINSYETKEFAPKPSPLCAFCPYSRTSTCGEEHLRGLCNYYSLWTRENKTYEVVRPYKATNETVTKPRFIF